MSERTELWEKYKDVFFFLNKELTFDSYAIITAWNPSSQWVSNRENQRANQSLQEKFDGFKYCKLWVGDLKRRWLEESFAVELPQNLAIELGKKYHQNAIYYVKNDELYLISCVENNYSERIGNLSQRLVVEEKE